MYVYVCTYTYIYTYMGIYTYIGIYVAIVFNILLTFQYLTNNYIIFKGVLSEIHGFRFGNVKFS